MRILMMTPDLPAPPTSGGRIRMYQIAHHLAREHALDLFSPEVPDPDGMAATRALCRTLWLYPPPSPETILTRLSRYTRQTLTANMYPWRREVANRLRQVLSGESYDLLQVETPYLSRYLPPYHGRLPIVMDFFGTTLGVGREFLYARSLREKAFQGLRYLVARWAEKRCLQQCNIVTAASEVDRDYLQALARGTSVHVIQNGVDVEYFTPRPDLPSEEATLVFVGDMQFAPNVDAMRFFHESILPRLRHRVPRITVWIVGRDPAPEVRALATQGPYRLTGFVEDIRPYLARATAVILPIRLGAGVRTKALEALAMGKAVVSTSAGIEGIEVESGKHLLVADTAHGFADAVATLLRDPGQREQLGRAARQLMEEKYSWPRCLEGLSTLHRRLVAERVCQEVA